MGYRQPQRAAAGHPAHAQRRLVQSDNDRKFVDPHFVEVMAGVLRGRGPATTTS